MFFVYIGLASAVISLLLLLGLERYWVRKNQSAGISGGNGVAEESGSEAESNLPGKRWRIAGVLLLVAITGYLLLFSNGYRPAVEKDGMAKQSEEKTGQSAKSVGDLDTVVKKLADKMANDPNNGEGWLLLAKTYGELERFAEADAAFAKASPLLALDASVLADWADAHVMAHNRKWDAEGREIIKRAFAADPKHPKALALAGSEAFDRAEYKLAIEFWTRMKAVAPVDSIYANVAETNIAEAKARLSGKNPPAATADTGGVAPVVAGVVTLSPKLIAQVHASDTVFVVAKGADGSGPPLAVARFKATDFPIEFRLDDSSAIMPGRTISQSPEVVITARVSKTGTAESAKGDIVAAPIKAKLGNTTLALELDTVR